MGQITYKKAVTFSYDDGITQDCRLVELLNRYGLKATFNLNTGIQSKESCFDIEGVHIERMEQEGLAKLYEGHEIAVHGLTHAMVSQLSPDEWQREFLEDAKNIERLYGKYPVGMAWAYGDHPEDVADYLAEIGLKYGRTTMATHQFDLPANPLHLAATCHHNDEQLFDLAEQFLALDASTLTKPALFYIWGHSYEFDVDRNWDRIEQLFQMISGKDDIFYGTNAQCLGY